MTRALVTGGTGFIGSHLVARLAADGHDVVAPVRATSAPARVDALRALGATTPVVDDTAESVAAAVRNARPLVTYHLATHFVAEHRPDDVARLVASNIQFGAQVLEALQAIGGGPFVALGTGWQQFGNADYSPTSLYAASKQAFEALLRFYTDVGAVRSQFLLLSDSYGPGDPRRKLLAVMCDAERTGATVELSGGDQRVDLVHVRDVLDALVLAAERLRADDAVRAERWALRTGRSVTLRELTDLFQRARGTTLSLRWGARPYRARETFDPWTAGETLPGWTPRVSLEEGLRTLGDGS